MDDLIEMCLEPGKSVFVRTVTYHYTGRVVKIDASWILLEECAWVADSGRFNRALVTGELAEVEPIPGRVLLSRAAIVDVIEWSHPLPKDVL